MHRLLLDEKPDFTVITEFLFFNVTITFIKLIIPVHKNAGESNESDCPT